MSKLSRTIIICVLFLTILLIYKSTYILRDYKTIGTEESIGLNKLEFNRKTTLILLDTQVTNTGKSLTNEEMQTNNCLTHADKLCSIINEINPNIKKYTYVVADNNGNINNELLYEALSNIYSMYESNIVINMSFKTVEEPRLNKVIKKLAENPNVIMVASAGNDNKNFSRYPASSKYVLSICGINEEGNLSMNSNYGNVDYGMPEKYITKYNEMLEGTSVSALLFSIAVVGIWDKNYKLDNSEIKRMILDYTINPDNNSNIGNGQISIK